MITTLNLTEITQLEQRYRTNLINSLSGFKSLNLIGTNNQEGNTNLAIFNSVFHVGAHPPLMGFIVRPDSVERHTLANILSTQHYTINHINKHIYKQAHQTSARYPQNQSEFQATGLTPTYLGTFNAPFVSESNIKIGLILKEIIELKTNATKIVIGEIQIIQYPKQIANDDGYLDIENAETITGTALDAYHTTQLITRLPYAKP